jgi:hypothetical protein
MAENWQLKAVLSANAAGLIKTLDSVNKATRSTRKHLADIGSGSLKLAQNLALPVGLLGGLAAGFSVAGVVQAAKNFALLGDEVAKGSQKAGVGIAEFQRWSYVAGQSGIDVGTLTGSMGKLNKQVAEAAAGKNKELAALFTKAGISMRGANGELRNSAELLPEIADLFARNTNAATQARMGNAVFGKSWQELAPLLLGGSEGINQLTQRYKELGLEVDAGAIKAGEAFGDQLDDLHQVTRSYANTVMTKLLPVLSPLLEKTIQWAVANRAVITTRITEFVSNFAAAMERVDWNAVVEGVAGFFNGLKTLVDWVGGARNALIALVVFMNASSILAFVSMAGSVLKFGVSLAGLASGALPTVLAGLKMVATAVRVVGSAMISNPIGLLAMGLATAAYLIYDNWETLKGWFTSFFDWLGEKFQWVIELAKSVGSFVGLSSSDSAQSGGALMQSRPALVTPQSRGRVEGEVNININGLPQGSRVEQDFTRSDIPLNTSVGYHSFATGMP